MSFKSLDDLSYQHNLSELCPPSLHHHKDTLNDIMNLSLNKTYHTLSGPSAVASIRKKKKKDAADHMEEFV